MFKEQQRNLAASFHLTQSPTTRVPIFNPSHRVTLENQMDRIDADHHGVGRSNVLPPTYQSVPPTVPVQKYDIDRMIKSLE